ncbi:hypothetical protein QFZ35_003241 [Arthrobacter ulcerisalmonis]|nr:hypothetical protein [Arthrobacter ulcerisalmonis]MDQ0664743.1 hypothetical protein [Arthrobacter ulcerisalmonis]
MGTNKHHLLALLGAAALALSACGTQSAAPAPAPSTPASDAAVPSSAPSPEARKAPTPVDVDQQMLAPIPGMEQSVSDRQMVIGQAYISSMVTDKYTLSGQWVEDGATHANTATLWSNYFSQELQDKLTAAGTGDITNFANWAIFALAAPGSTDNVKASPACVASPAAACTFLTQEPDGSFTMIGETLSMDISVPDRIAYNRTVAVPVSLTSQGNAEGVMTGTLKVDLSFVPNPNPGPGKPEFLINSVNNALADVKTDLLSNHPELKPM